MGSRHLTSLLLVGTKIGLHLLDFFYIFFNGERFAVKNIFRTSYSLDAASFTIQH